LLRFKILVVGRTRTSFLQEGETFYLDRLRRYVKTDWVEVKAARTTRTKPEAEVIREEGLALSKRLRGGEVLVPLDRTGVQHDSEGLARWLRGLSERPGGPVAFLIGGPLGLSRDLIGRAEEVLSLSRLTLTHEMVRLVLLEQLYRACTILSGEKYHK
jgi:23S rRNA (pseudouridine1915-N3)-methyltransferase